MDRCRKFTQITKNALRFELYGLMKGHPVLFGLSSLIPSIYFGSSDFRVERYVCLYFIKSDFRVDRYRDIGYSLDGRGVGNGGNIFIVLECCT